MKITKLIIPQYNQFKDFELDLTYPEGHPKAGQPLEKVCFIGGNGTGKSTLLNILQTNLYYLINVKFVYPSSYKNRSIIEFQHKNNTFWSVYDLTSKPEWISTFNKEISLATLLDSNFNAGSLDDASEVSNLSQDIHKNRQNFILIHSPAESSQNHLLNLQDVPLTNVDTALKLQKENPFYRIVSNDYIANFWTQLIISIKERESKWFQFLDLPENQEKTQKQLKEIFDAENPKILKELADLWNKILDKCGLYFDYENAKLPIQLLDNLHAYIKVKATNETIQYHQLSTGIRNFIFRLGHIFSLYFHREIESGFLLVDEPENSLFPDFKYELIDIYSEIIKGKNTQFFVATHSPIIAAQFEPCERVILAFDEEGFVTTGSCHKGVMGEGDDPNDILQEDFGMKALYGKKGLEMWNRFLTLRKLMKETEDKTQKEAFMDEFLKIAKEYKFSVK